MGGGLPATTTFKIKKNAALCSPDGRHLKDWADEKSVAIVVVVDTADMAPEGLAAVAAAGFSPPT